MKKILAFVLFSVLAHPVLADSTWYRGKVNRIALISGDGSFVITFAPNENGVTALDDCKYKYAYFNLSSLGETRLKHAYSMALTSITAKLPMGVVLDKSINGTNGICNATGMTADLSSE